MDEKSINYITISPEEDQFVISTEQGSDVMTLGKYGVMTLISIIILSTYLFMNSVFYPAYPVIQSFAENIEHYAEHYPPFRMNEWTFYTIAEDAGTDYFWEPGHPARTNPVAFPLIAAPLIGKFGEIGIYYANAFIMWACALVFMVIMIRIVPFAAACVFTLILAFATPNLFFAASAYVEPLGQLMILLSIFFFVKGLSSNRELVYYTLCGVVIGLNLFVNPFMISAVVLFAVVIFSERSDWSWNNKGVLCLCAGFVASIGVFFIFYRVIFGSFLENARSYFFYLVSDTGLFPVYDRNSNVMVGIWKLLFDSPHGLVFIMPVTMLTPIGFIAMWRKKMRSLALLAGMTVLFLILGAAGGFCALSGESVGTRQLVSIVPLLIMPLAFIWGLETGEKAVLAVLTVLTIYICGFGWWAGTVRERGVFIGVLHDRNSQGIMLARKNMLPRPLFRSSNEIVRAFFSSLETENMYRWLQTLDRVSFEEIQGFEREVFNDFVRSYRTVPTDQDRFIASVNPDEGIRLVIPEIIFKPEPDKSTGAFGE